MGRPEAIAVLADGCVVRRLVAIAAFATGRRVRRPYGVLPVGEVIKGENAVDVIRHDDKGVQFDAGEMAGDRPPTSLSNLTSGAKPDGVVIDLTEEALTTVGADRDVIQTSL